MATPCQTGAEAPGKRHELVKSALEGRRTVQGTTVPVSEHPYVVASRLWCNVISDSRRSRAGLSGRRPHWELLQGPNKRLRHLSTRTIHIPVLSHRFASANGATSTPPGQHFGCWWENQKRSRLKTHAFFRHAPRHNPTEMKMSPWFRLCRAWATLGPLLGHSLVPSRTIVQS